MKKSWLSILLLFLCTSLFAHSLEQMQNNINVFFETGTYVKYYSEEIHNYYTIPKSSISYLYLSGADNNLLIFNLGTQNIHIDLKKYMFYLDAKNNIYIELRKYPADTSFDKSKPMNISVFSLQKESQPNSDNRDFNWIEKTFGVKFTWDICGSNEYTEIFKLIDTEDLPDLLEINSEKFKTAGCLIDLKPLLERYCPNLMINYRSIWKKMIYQDSEKDEYGKITKEHIYVLPNLGSYTGADQSPNYNENAFWIQKRVLKEFGYPSIKTVDQYFDLIEKYLQKYPETDDAKTIGFNIITADWEAFNLWNPPNYLAGYPNDGNGHVISNTDGTFTFADNFTDENAKLWFSKTNEYFNRGLIDSASFSDNRDRYYAKMANGRVLGMFIQGWEFMYDAEKRIRDSGHPERTYVPLPIVFDDTIKPHYRSLPLPNLERGYGISKNCNQQKVIEILKFFDTLLEEKNQKRLYWGVEGEDYLIDKTGAITGKIGAPYRTQQQRNNQTNSAWIKKNKATLLTVEAPKWEGSYSDGYPTNLNYLPWEYALEAESSDIEVFKAYNVGSYAQLMDKNPPANSSWYPLWQANPTPEYDGLEHDAAVAMYSIETLQRKYLPLLIMCNPAQFESIWNEYFSQMRPLTEVYNKFMQQELNKRIQCFGGE